MKKPVKAAAAPARAAGKAAQPGNAPGRGKSAHVHAAAPKKVPAKVKAARHAAAVKAAKTRAANAKKAKHHPRRGYAVGELLPVCSFEAVAQALRLAGQRVTDDDIAGLWGLYGTVSIGDALAGFEAELGEPLHGLREVGLDVLGGVIKPGHSLILGIDVPGPHAVLATPDGWWSWGELYEPWTDDIDEAWEVTWPGIR